MPEGAVRSEAGRSRLVFKALVVSLEFVYHFLYGPMHICICPEIHVGYFEQKKFLNIFLFIPEYRCSRFIPTVAMFFKEHAPEYGNPRSHLE